MRSQGDSNVTLPLAVLLLYNSSLSVDLRKRFEILARQPPQESRYLGHGARRVMNEQEYRSNWPSKSPTRLNKAKGRSLSMDLTPYAITYAY